MARGPGPRGIAAATTSHLVAVMTAVLAWTVATGATGPAGAAPPPPYASLVVGAGVLAALATAAEVRRTDRLTARLAAGAVAGVTVLAQSLVATTGGPMSTGGHWSVEGATVVLVGVSVLVTVTLDARRRAAATDPVRPYAR